MSDLKDLKALMERSAEEPQMFWADNKDSIWAHKNE